MANLIDGVIQAGSQFGVQCLQAVTNLTGIATSAGGTAFSTAADLANWAKSTGNLSATPALGDVAVWGGGQGGALSAGHAGIVTGLSNGVQVTSTNWPSGAGETQYTVGQGNNPVGMGNPLGYIDPTVLGGTNVITGQTASGITNATTTAARLAGTSITYSGKPYQTLSQSITAQSSIIPGEAAIAGFASWISQGTLLRRIGFTAFGIFLAWYGLHLMTSVDSPVQVVGGAVGKVVK